MIIAFAFFIVIITFPVSAWFCFKVSPTIWEKWNSAEIKIYPLSYHAGGERIRESGHLPAWWKLYKNLFPTKNSLFLSLASFHIFCYNININFQCWGRLKHGGARGPGLFFVLPYVDTFRRVGRNKLALTFSSWLVFFWNVSCSMWGKVDRQQSLLMTSNHQDMRYRSGI